MFIQVIEGTTDDAEAFHRQLEVWQRDLASDAVGYLGSTAGVTEAGDCIVIARFESAEAARRNSERPEQSAWWAETARCFLGGVRFHESEDVQVMEHGAPGDAGFVQVMEGHVADPVRAHELGEEADEVLAEARPDLLATVTAFFDDGEYASVAFFTSEAEARRNEQAEPPPELAAGLLDEWARVMQTDRYLDLTRPWLVNA
jgi:hypothetical protein